MNDILYILSLDNLVKNLESNYALKKIKTINTKNLLSLNRIRIFGNKKYHKNLDHRLT